MQTRALALALMAVLGTGPVWAQDTATDQGNTVQLGDTPDPATDLNMGQTEAEAQAAEGPQPGQPYIRETFGDWGLRCINNPDGDDPCQLYQLLRNGEDVSVAEISVFPLADGGRAAAGATIVVPLETLLTENLKLSIDGGAARIYPFSFCNRAGCVARIGLTGDDVASFKRGAKAVLTLVPAAAPTEKVKLDVSLTGFTAGLNSVEAQ